MLRRVQQWFRRRRNQFEEQETEDSDTYSGEEIDFEEARPSPDEEEGEEGGGRDGAVGGADLGEPPFFVFEDPPDLERAGPQFHSTPRPGLRPGLRVQDRYVRLPSSIFLLSCSTEAGVGSTSEFSLPFNGGRLSSLLRETGEEFCFRGLCPVSLY